MLNVETIYKGRDNNIDIELRENGKNIADYSPITRVLVSLESNLIDSDVNPEWLDWSGNSLVIKVGLSGIVAGKYTTRVETWDATNINGIVWTESLKVIIRN
ncbi:MAG: hypothetical protein GQ532_14930 [Methylomarinum sp.]|nr:hypothetical protein [Methylomarinum sp.]